MFTGIITNTTAVKKTLSSDKGISITFKKPLGWPDLAPGESVSTDGVCLTVVDVGPKYYDCHLMPETLKKTTFGKQMPREVNLERSLRMGDRFSGHMVAGHVDDVGKVTKIVKAKEWQVYIEFAPKHKKLIVNKGSVALNGISLTVVEVKGNTFYVSLIPFTLKRTTLSNLKVDDLVNIEFDMIGKYLHAHAPSQ